MPDVGEPVDVSATVIERMNELVGDHPAHVGLTADIVLAQHNLWGTKIQTLRDRSACLLTPTTTRCPAGSLVLQPLFIYPMPARLASPSPHCTHFPDD